MKLIDENALAKMIATVDAHHKGEIMKIPVNEQETVINFTRDSDKATVYTTDTTMLTKLHKLTKKNPEEWRLVDQDTVNGIVISETFECPNKLISLRAILRVMTEEQRYAEAEILKKVMKNK